jgi:pimeloyl-ACP methyl ester carboxylesterase
VLVGEHDGHDFHAIASLIADEVAGTRPTVVPGTAHVPNYERPDVFDPLLAAAIDPLTSRRSSAGRVR